MTCHKIEMIALGVVIAQAASSITNDVCRSEIADSIDFPIYIHTSCKMRIDGNYLSLGRGVGGNGSFGNYWFGEPLHCVAGEARVSLDDGQTCFLKQCKAVRTGHQLFQDATLFFENETKRLYKIVTKQEFPVGSLARDRMMVVNGIIEDCRLGYGLALVRTVTNDSQIVYQYSDKRMEVVLEMGKNTDGSCLVVFSVINKKVRSGIVASPQLEAFDNPIEVDI